ncbi:MULTISPECIES: PilZ domain-containing protein [Curvivirga]|uniref:PilZ domain-containing protein n=1 Tax=Curvivirga TaxID=2856846 RepID=UPI0012BD4124|nr:PilZ domain-containing protein [Curvivirga aplysinae]MTI08541.1 PilZ domain-containing protein [Curvivirga aplysinae]
MSQTYLHSWTPTGDKRKDKRVETALPVVVGSLTGTAINISMGGMGFTPDGLGLVPGMETHCILKFSSGPITLGCKVIHANRDMSVFGVQFLGLDKEAFEKIQFLITHPTKGL